MQPRCACSDKIPFELDLFGGKLIELSSPDLGSELAICRGGSSVGVMGIKPPMR